MTVASEASESRPLVVVAGIGASAGGLTATSELLRHLGGRPGLAAVVVQHLDPTHESSLVEILARVTALPVHLVTEGMSVVANHVYVAPPDASVTISQGILRLTPRPETGSLYLPIDLFFGSLAADRSVEALGVVLSGTGSDGALGIRAIKASGGVTFAQDASAEFRGMPDSAVATGCVDFVLPPNGIARELARIGELGLSSSPDDSAELQRVLTALTKESGIAFANYKETTLRRRIRRRVVVNGLATLREYADRVEQNRDEACALCDEVLIHVTSFFRDPEMFEALKTAVFPKLLENRPRDSAIRIWIPACSTGEEVYSLAMILLEFLGDAGAGDIPVKLFGTDVSLGAIDKSRAGKYPGSIENEVSAGRLQRFFVKLDGSYQIRKEVRDLCIFARQDATRDPPFAGMDLISCRNLMIYLGAPLQDRILPILHYALKEPGFLVLGSAETVRSFPGFVALDGKNRIYARTSAAPPAFFNFAARRFAELEPAEVLATSKPSVPQDLNREADRLVLAAFGPPGVLVTEDLAIVQFRGRTSAFLEPTAGVASLDLLRMVREELRVPLRRTIDEARQTKTTARRAGVALGPGARAVDLEVIPFRVPSRPQPFFIVLFRDLSPTDTEGTPPSAPAPSAPSGAADHPLAQELASTRQYLQSVIEQLEAGNEALRAANEEIVSSNEELRSANEELQMTKQEVQATNEELGTVNEEMSTRTTEVTRLNDDLTNVLSSVAIPIVILGRDSSVRRFTPAGAKLFRLLPGDVGRPLGDVKTVFPGRGLPLMIAEVLERLAAVERTVQDGEGRWYQLTVLPYVTLDNRIDGTVIAAIDIDAVKKSELLLDEARRYAESIVDTIRECLVVMEPDGRVRSANPAFLRTFGLKTEEVVDRNLYNLGHGEWNIPALRTRIEAMGEGDALENHRVERDLPGGGHHVLVVNARRIARSLLILLAIDDVTEKAEAETNLRSYQEKVQQMAFDAVLTEERERRRIAVEVHDQLGQSLSAARIKLTSLREAVAGASRGTFDEAVELLTRSIADTRTLIFDLSPPVLYDLGLRAALSWLGEDIERRHGVKIELFDDAADKPLDDATAALVFRSVREVLANVVKHAKVTTARVSLRREGDDFEIDLEDAGVGFDPNDVAARSSRGTAFGLFSVREQLSRLGGTVEVSSGPQWGTRVRMRVPLKIKESPRGSSDETLA